MKFRRIFLQIYRLNLKIDYDYTPQTGTVQKMI